MEFPKTLINYTGIEQGKIDMTPEIRTLISGVIFMTKYTKDLNFPLTKVGLYLENSIV